MNPKHIVSSFFVGVFLFGINPSLHAEQVNRWTDHSDRVEVLLDKGTLVLTPQADNAIRVQYTTSTGNELPEYVFLDQTKRIDYKVLEQGSKLEIVLPKMRASLDKEQGYLVFKDEHGKVILSEQVDGRTIYNHDLRNENTFLVEQKFESPKDEFIYGTGQFQDGFLNIRGVSRRLTQLNTQISIPFILSSKGYGLLWHNYGLTYYNPADQRLILKRSSEQLGNAKVVSVTTNKGSQLEKRVSTNFYGTLNINKSGKYAVMLDVGSSTARELNIRIDDKQQSEVKNIWLPKTTTVMVDLEEGKHDVVVRAVSKDKPEILFREVTDETVFRSPVADCLDYTVFSGYGDEVISAYRNLTGHAPMMPKWALGYIHCRERFHTQEELLQTAKRFRKDKYPLDLIVQDWMYWGKYGWNSMQFDEKNYPNPVQMVDQLHKMDLRLMLSVWSKVDEKSTLGKELAEHNYYIPGTTWVDFFNPKAAAYYWDRFRQNLLSTGIDAWWQDATEPENDDLHGRVVADGHIKGERLRNIYPLFVCKTVYEGCRKDQPEKRTMILTRSGFSGMQRYAAATWSGDVGNDWETLRRQVAAGLNYMASGMPWWTFDAGGFFRPGKTQYTSKDYQERFLRWFQIATFLPLQRVHGYQTDTEFWNYGPQVEKVARKYLDLRYRMLPYIYSETAAITFKGSTLMRPFVMDFPHDAEALACNYSYMFGPSLLVAPVLEPSKTELSVYLPDSKQTWYDFWTGEKKQGGQHVDVPVSIDKIPLFVKAGSILPLGERKQHVSDKEDDAWEIRIYSGQDGHYTIYEDEGINYNYEQGKYSTYELTWNDKQQVLTISDRKGSFDNMVEKRKLRIVKVTPKKGVGDTYTKKTDKVVNYNGKEIVLKF